jgi:hypothetical protein
MKLCPTFRKRFLLDRTLTYRRIPMSKYYSPRGLITIHYAKERIEILISLIFDKRLKRSDFTEGAWEYLKLFDDIV